MGPVQFVLGYQGRTRRMGGGFRLAVEVITNVFADIRVSCFDDLIGSPKAKIEDIPIGLGLMEKKQITDRVHVYGGGGLSIHLLDGQENAPETPRDTFNPDDEPGFYFALGIESLFLEEELEKYHVNGVALFAETSGRRRIGSTEKIHPQRLDPSEEVEPRNRRNRGSAIKRTLPRRGFLVPLRAHHAEPMATNESCLPLTCGMNSALRTAHCAPCWKN